MNATTEPPAKLELLPIMRPNGKVYRPRKIRTESWDNEEDTGVIVLGTHDVERAHLLAVEGCRYFFGCQYAINPDVDWFRQGYQYGDPMWFRDDVRGSAGVMFTASDDPEELA